jgi:hypothetical protein
MQIIADLKYTRMENYYVDVKVKPYVKQYLINNCGNPVNLSHLPKFDLLFKRLIRKPLLRFESLPCSSDNCYVRVIITSDTFYRYGWEITRTNALMFNAEIEREMKFLMRTFITTRASLGYSIAQSIRDFQTKFNMPETIWSFDAIKKDIDRHTESKRNPDIESFLNEINKKMYKIFLENLSTIGTISKKYKNELSEV